MAKIGEAVEDTVDVLGSSNDDGDVDSHWDAINTAVLNATALILMCTSGAGNSSDGKDNN